MDYEAKTNRTWQILLLLLTILIVGGAIYWGMASSS
jgi:hypothetical protein